MAIDRYAKLTDYVNITILKQNQKRKISIIKYLCLKNKIYVYIDSLIILKLTKQ